MVTFYDFDQQAVLLALDLEEALAKTYAESCRYYLVFLDENYNQKVWTRYERDIMTRPGRKDHVIPVVLDDLGSGGVVGIPKTVGRIDLRDQWTEMRRLGRATVDVVNAIRNRCVLPILEKLNDVVQAV